MPPCKIKLRITVVEPHPDNLNLNPARLNVKLPTIKLPTFKGNYEHWLSFKDTFNSVINSNDRISAIEKFQYLRCSLEGEALEVIRSLETSAENYRIAWNALRERYENKRLIVNKHMKELFDLPQIVKSSHVNLRQFVDQLKTNLRALAMLKQPVESWDTMLIYLATGKLDYQTRKEWEKHINLKEEEELPNLNDFLEFLTNQCQTLEMVQHGQPRQENRIILGPKKNEKRIALATTTQSSCWYCKGGHMVNRCDGFLKLPLASKREEVKSRRLCWNCLRQGHLSKDCKSCTCRKCSKRHHTLLHVDNEQEKDSASISQEATRKRIEGSDFPHNPNLTDQAEGTSTIVNAAFNSAAENDSVVEFCSPVKARSRVLLSTALVHVCDSNGKQHTCRVLLDPGSQANLITEELAAKLKLPSNRINYSIGGINQTQSKAREAVNVKIKSLTNGYETTIECLALPTITDHIPQVRISISDIKIPAHVRLADPGFNIPGKIDLLIGAGLFWEILCVGQVYISKHQPRIQKTLLGWVIGGELISQDNKEIPLKCHFVASTLDQELEKFWKTEEVLEKPLRTKEDERCEEFFSSTVTGNKEGRYIVSLPKKTGIVLGNSKNEALRRLYSLEKRLQRQSTIKKEYEEFMDEYLKLGHMELSTENRGEEDRNYEVDSLTTKLRVVFDGSAKTDSGNSLNDMLSPGPNLQADIMDLVLRFRCYPYVLTADITKMFRQILVAKTDRGLQSILWRKDKSQPIQNYNLTTVTYGTACAPYLAMRCLKQLVVDEGNKFPMASLVVESDFYMDDLITGAETIKEASSLQQQVSELLKKGCFPLCKWRSNDSRVLAHLSEKSKSNTLLVLDKQDAIKTLGLLWNNKEDYLQYRVTVPENSKPTKRHILSCISRIYDPLGLLGPVTVKAKLIMQELWKLDLSWDESLPQHIHTVWLDFYESLPGLDKVLIPRNVNPDNKDQKFDIHGFGDASEKAYGACLFAVSRSKAGIINSRLICSKTRIAPLKTLSLPRLELNAALLLSKLVNKVQEALQKRIRDIHLWSDSTIVLGWIQTQPHLLKTFVANRVSTIQRRTEGIIWHHVRSHDNPADPLSRGLSVEELQNCTLWWKGPEWLSNGMEWPEQPLSLNAELPELKTRIALAGIYEPPSLLTRFSSFKKLRRVIAYCIRFIQACKKQRKDGPLAVEELDLGQFYVIRMVQHDAFAPELKLLAAGKPLNAKSKLLSLCPIVDERNLIRVGGRLRNALIPEEQKHPIILPSRHHVTTIIMRDEHQRLGHCGPEQLLNSMRKDYWPLSGRREARKVTRACVPCFRYKPKLTTTVMADLPSSRVQGFSRPFVVTGVDYAGPITVREGKRRGRIPTSKAYIAVFVCFHTKAVHLELIGNLSTEAFLAGLRRFVARRGICSHLYSDNATNFTGANRELKEIYEFLSDKEPELKERLANQRIKWSFIPPRSPHFGGLWEAAVKAVKRHLYTITKGLNYTFEEYYTLLTQVEAILNSRPLTPVSSDPQDLSALTPSHFLIGDSLLEPVQRSYLDTPDNQLSRWQHTQKLSQHFWKRWTQEYLHQLQTRSKWHAKAQNLEIGTMVLLMEENLPPLQWCLGRIIEVHPGVDDVVRVVTVKTKSGNFKRAVRKICALPIDIH